MICLACGTNNSVNSSNCVNCNNNISPASPHSSHISQIIRAGESVLDGRGNPEILENMLEQLFRLFDELEEKQSELQENIPGECKEIFLRFKEGNLLLFDGLDEIDIYFEDFNKDHIIEGLKLLKEAEELHYDTIKECDEIVDI